MANTDKQVTKDSALKKQTIINMLRSALPIIGLVVVFIVFNTLTKGNMWTSRKLILNQVYVVLISTVGVFFIMTMGGLDFSQGSIMGMASIVVCMLSKVNIVLAIVGGVLAGAAIGAVNGFFYVNRKIKSFIVTICTMFLFRGFIKYMASNSPVAASMKVYDYDTLGIKLGITLAVLAVSFLVFRFTKFGIHLKAIGAGEKATKFAGVRTDRVKFLIYVLAGAITGLAAFVNIVKNGSATANVGNQLETQILIALVLGGMPISGGAKVRFENIIVGSLLYIVLNNGLIMMGLTTQAMQLIQGVIFLIFVALFADRQSLSVIK
ncbi:ribose transport system permease protein [Lachnospiraceae bacterium YSD2013]|nr:ABC transporter permease [Lachnospiraceae bacterium]MBR5761333.1 ABC transporter permease [Lachnospiraceae bacterium]MBR5994386.1 ABC transporter permease [Lachnospiraceae bacterium]MCR4678916.1 ABC transporter permease [Lachnospiraceae bacterium]SCX02541.1 ribose transport system permease protein [Lachnospiraceae bacterium YSD2013]